jgi:hypothetical protein
MFAGSGYTPAAYAGVSSHCFVVTCPNTLFCCLDSIANCRSMVSSRSIPTNYMVTSLTDDMTLMYRSYNTSTNEWMVDLLSFLIIRVDIQPSLHLPYLLSH